MKNFIYTTLLFLFSITALPAQIVINEIMYNPPEAGADSLEYLEILNNSTLNLDMTDWSLSGVTFTFPAGTMLNAGEYIVVAKNATAMANLFSITALEWTDGSLSNGGETLQLLNGNGAVVDEVAYDDAGDWTDVPDGDGPSLELCDPDTDNTMATNWYAATNGTGVMIDGIEVLGTPGAANTVACVTTTPDATVTVMNFSFSPADITINVGETVEWNAISGTHNVNGSTADYPANPEGFSSGAPASSPWTFSHTFNIAGDYGYRCDPHFGNGMVGTVTVLEAPAPAYPMADIGVINTVDTDGVADSLNKPFQIRGIVHGGDFRGGNGVQFTMIDPTGGIGVFSFDNATYTVAEGDELIIEGNINQFNGLTQMNPDTIIFVSANNGLVTPTVVTALGEDTESNLVRINGLSLVDPADWTNSGSGFNVDVTDGSSTFTMRVDADTDLFGEPAPTGAFDAIGIGGQFDSSSPFTSGYQLFPRYVQDIIPIAGNDLDAFDDLASTDENTAVDVMVLDNDNVPNALTSFTIGDMPMNGTATVVGDTVINYNPTMDFCGDDSFTYILCDASLCDTATVNITVECAAVYPLYPIGEVTTVDQNGVADSVDVTCEIRGIVYGINLRPSGLQFTIIDKDNPNDGIGLFNNTGDLGYTVTEGDEVAIQGTISQFSGLLQINPDNVMMLSSGNTLHDAEAVTALGESTESKLVKLEGMSFVDPMEWTGMGSGFNVDITDGINTYAMRIDADVDLYSMPIPGFATFNVVGIGGQFDSSDPFDSGYQILPRYMSDIQEITSLVDPELGESVAFFPNPVNNTLMINTEIELDEIVIRNVLGQQVKTISNPQLSTEVNVADLASGMYLITFVSYNRIWTAELIKQ